jgi:hypothetical protein
MKTKRYLTGAAVGAVLALPAAAAADYSPGEYKGTNSQGRPMTLTVGEGEVLRYGQALKMTCREGRRRYTEGGRFTSRVPLAIDADGDFAAKRSSKGFKPSISGHVEGTRASGKFRLSFKRGGRSCTSPLVRWTAELADR